MNVGLLSIRMVGRLHIAGGSRPGRNQNHYTPIYHLLLKDHHTKLMCNSFKSLSVMLHENPSHAKPDILLGCWNVIKSWFYTTPAVQKLHISFYQQIPFGGATMICALLCYFLKNVLFILNICAMLWEAIGQCCELWRCVLFTRNLFMDIREFHLSTASNRSW